MELARDEKNQSSIECEDRPVAIHIEDVTKVYRLGQIGGGTLQADIQSWWARKRGKEDPNSVIGQEKRLVGKTFMALNGVSLDIYEGERIGIIGANGAGKSTMLKLLSRVTAPTSGEIDIFGRVTSMLEVGTGFNGEMTGRENIYMNGAILGMTKAEVDAKMEAIIDFSEVRDFIDTPVKRYSSGMYVKLAFSVAAHLDSEIIIMDEVLAVGDVQFQNKCINKMRSIALDEGKTVLYVSHNMNTIRNLCNRCIVMDQGKIVFDGDVDKAIQLYSTSREQGIKHVLDVSESVRGEELKEKKIYIQKVELSEPYIKMGEKLVFSLFLSSKEMIKTCLLKCVLLASGNEILGIVPSEEFSVNRGDNIVVFEFDTKELSPGTYVIDIIISEHDEQGYYNRDKIANVVMFQVEESVRYFDSNWNKRYWGNVLFNKIKICK